MNGNIARLSHRFSKVNSFCDLESASEDSRTLLNRSLPMREKNSFFLRVDPSPEGRQKRRVNAPGSVNVYPKHNSILF